MIERPTLAMSQNEIAELVSEWYERYADDVLRVCYFYLNDRQQAEDVMQEVFIRMMKKPPKVIIEGKEKAWLLKVALNLCRDLWRTGWMKRVIVGSKKLEMLPAEADKVDDYLEKQALLQAVHALPAADREVFLLFYYQGYTTEEIADMLDTPAGTISSRLSRGRVKLKELLEEGNDS